MHELNEIIKALKVIQDVCKNITIVQTAHLEKMRILVLS